MVMEDFFKDIDFPNHGVSCDHCGHKIIADLTDLTYISCDLCDKITILATIN